MTTSTKIQDKAQAITEKLGLDWSVSTRPLFGGQGERTPFFGIFNDQNDNCLGVAKSRYTPLQNIDLIETIVSYFPEINEEKISVSFLKEGRDLIIKIEDENIFAGTAAEAKSYTLIRESRSGQNGLSFATFKEVLICSNGMKGFRKFGNVNFVHASTLEAKLKAFDGAYANILEWRAQEVAIMDKMRHTPLLRSDVRAFVDSLLSIDSSITNEADFKAEFGAKKWNIMHDLNASIDLELNRQGKNQFGLLNGVTHFTNHVQKHRAGSDEHLIDGAGSRLNSKAWKLLAQ